MIFFASSSLHSHRQKFLFPRKPNDGIHCDDKGKGFVWNLSWFFFLQNFEISRMSDSQRVVVYILISNKKNYFIKLLSLRICYPEETYFFFFLASFMVALTHMPFRCISQNLSLIRFIKLNVIDRIDLS